MGYQHTNSKGKTYFLHSKNVTLRGGRNQTIYYFAKEAKAWVACTSSGAKRAIFKNTARQS